ncbi:hypothetical protein SAMN05216548_114115 [Faunimonas pinastri]|uniref:HTH cro/C1-type domain-containing protein n=1 Tax=Faunimonas pinastri TaxID=1855383 RepID=A0A1H9MZG1_9HYPH|nr:helix-turn-helix transcriptional regulator [Faunimonas pinastri]SER28961.1 hypothetical protein SAMN05216548_114115 [Faunimonas pinastri]
MPARPFEHTRLASYLSKQIDAIQGMKTQRQIADEVGYDKPNMISMIKRGEARVPMDKIPLLAKSLNVDPAFLFRLAMEQHGWSIDVIGTVFGTICSKNESKVLAKIRELTDNQDPSLTPDLEQKLETVFGSPTT